MKYLIVIIISLISVQIRATINKFVKPETKFCYNCKNCRRDILDFFTFPPNQLQFAKCKAYPRVYEQRSFYVTGLPKVEYTDYDYCSIARNNPYQCGPEGKDYVAKDDP